MCKIVGTAAVTSTSYLLVSKAPSVDLFVGKFYLKHSFGATFMPVSFSKQVQTVISLYKTLFCYQWVEILLISLAEYPLILGEIRRDIHRIFVRCKHGCDGIPVPPVSIETSVTLPVTRFDVLSVQVRRNS